jgi:hypothetical protein
MTFAVQYGCLVAIPIVQRLVLAVEGNQKAHFLDMLPCSVVEWVRSTAQALTIITAATIMPWIVIESRRCCVSRAMSIV